jgi:hypothetical protein
MAVIRARRVEIQKLPGDMALPLGWTFHTEGLILVVSEERKVSLNKLFSNDIPQEALA